MEPFGQGDTIGLVLDYDEHKIGISRNAMFLGDLSLKGARDSPTACLPVGVALTSSYLPTTMMAASLSAA